MTASVQPSVTDKTAHGSEGAALSIRTFGPLEVRLDGEPVELPASRKTRALLAYLALSGNAQRRDSLCNLLWDTPHDPKSGLRWSLSKLRPVINAGGCTRLLTDFERVQISPNAIAVDFHELRACAKDDRASLKALAQAWELSNHVLIEDCELPNQPQFMAWLQHLRIESARLRVRLSRRLALSPELSAEDAQVWAQRWLQDAPDDPQAAERVAYTQRRLDCDQPAHAPAPDPSGGEDIAGAVAAAPRQVIRFVQGEDDAALAWACAGAARSSPLVIASNWLSHMELDWNAPVLSPLYQDLARTFRLIRYDERGCGLSDWDVPEISFETFVSDLEQVVDAAGLERFPLLGIGRGACVSIEYAARHPDRVSHLVLLGGHAAGWRHTATPQEMREREAVMVLAAAGWNRENPAYRGLFSRSFMPDANNAELSWFDELQRRATTPKNAVRFLEAFSRIDVRDRLQHVKAPTLVLHSRGDAAVPVAAGRELARGIANAEFVGLDSNNHLLLGREPASSELLKSIRRFVQREASLERGTAQPP